MGQPRDDRQSDRIICEGGLDSTENHINLSLNKPGAATSLLNYEVGLTGGYRRINGFQPFSSTYPEVGVGVAEGKVLGLAIFDNSNSGETEYIAARKDSGADTYTFYKFDVLTGWTAVTTGLTHTYSVGTTAVDKIRHDQSHDGNLNHLVFVDGINPAVLYDGINWGFIDSSNGGTTIADAGGDQVVDAPSAVAFFEKTLFLSGDSSYRGIVSFSAAGDFKNFTAAAGAGQLTPGLEVLTCKPFRENLYIFGRNGIRKAIADVSSGFLIDNVTDNIGALSPDGVMEIGGDLVFLAPDGFRPIAGTAKIGDVQLEVLSKPIQQLVKTRIDGNSNPKINHVVIRGKSQFRMFFGDDTREVTESVGIIGCMRTPDQTTGWEFGELRGIRVSTSISRYVGGTEYVLHGDYDGTVYQQEVGNSFNGENIISQYTTPFLDFGDTEIRKLMEKLTIFIRAEGDIVVTTSVKYDWGDQDVSVPASYTFEYFTDPSEYGDGTTYGSDVVYGGNSFPLIRDNIQGSFFSAQFDFVTDDTNPPFSIHGLVVEYGTQGRR